MIIHLFTSSKGGVGKTLCAVSTAAYYLSRGGPKVLCLDLNWENPDLSDVMCFGEEFRFGRKFAYVTIPGGDGLVLRPRALYTLPQGAPGFWYLVQTGLREARGQGHNLTHVVVDTGLHVGNLVKTSSAGISKLIRKRVGEIFDEAQAIYVWFVWTLVALRRKEDQAAIREMLETLRVLGGGRFLPESHLLHVLNPYALYPRPKVFDPDPLRDALTKQSPRQEISGLLKLAMADPRPGRSFEEFGKIISEALARAGRGPAYPEELLGWLGERILLQCGGRPRNLLCIPCFDSRVMGLTDVLLAGEEPTTLASLMEIVGKFEDKVSERNPSVLNVLGHCLDNLV